MIVHANCAIPFDFQHIKGQNGTVAWYYFVDVGPKLKCAISMYQTKLSTAFSDLLDSLVLPQK